MLDLLQFWTKKKPAREVAALKLFQFWDKKEPSQDVADLLQLSTIGRHITAQLNRHATIRPWFDTFHIEPAAVVRNIVLFRQEMDYMNFGEDDRAKLDNPHRSLYTS